MSAGLISVDQGLIKTLSPLSGHYRTRIGSFHHFLHELEKRGVNMKKVKVTKAEAALWGIEHLGKWQKKQKGLQKKGKEEVKDAATKVKMAVTTDDSWKKEVLEGRKKEEEVAAAQQNGHPPGF
ncbi:uncharacterized protein SCHCODRAFT_02722240 [Schizophyllum commune H4-8]|uniref:uncharacterized protein n=1 Tax=Schizophyllum commune (strain H4-8 / FGSC 9210) TaxID=578458 RepID=UPI00215E5585|nr:uncharacterized protein SCHCODRAFT_02722240 [Schizophyllum commune H4-8]KAI5898453.1 hypothetical protein SCHCODRAFT_02722240 [Schizophyllum commune H4-8]